MLVVNCQNLKLCCQTYRLRKNHSEKMVDESTKKTLSSIPLLKTKAGPRDKELWVQRLKEEYTSLIQVIQLNLNFK